MTTKISIRFNKDHKVRAIWDEKQNQWWFSVLDIVGAINEQDDHEKNRNYWKYLKAKLKKEQNEVVSNTTQLKLAAADGKRYNTDVKSVCPAWKNWQKQFLTARQWLSSIGLNTAKTLLTDKVEKKPTHCGRAISYQAGTLAKQNHYSKSTPTFTVASTTLPARNAFY